MKYFGKKSLSSKISVFLNISWYIVLIVAVVGVLFFSALIFIPDAQTLITAEIAKDAATNPKDFEDWQKFIATPFVVKLFMYPYFAAVIILLLHIIKKSLTLFDNFKNDVVFNRNNVAIITALNKVMIAFSIITFNFSGLLTCVLLLLLIEIFKNASALQEEHDLTI